VRGARWVTHEAAAPGTSGLADIKAAIRAELKADGMTQADLAAYMGVSPKHVSQVLTGKVTGSMAFVERMASAVGLSLEVSR
jgi:transcriptional regulator with XRE-family HTH domain